jgi:hypothetical protein
MSKYKIGDKVRVRSKEWIDAQKKNDYGYILAPKGCAMDMLTTQQAHAGEVTEILCVDVDGTYRISADNADLWWAEWMFDDPAGPEILSPEEAARAMLDREILLCPQDFGEPRCLAKWDGNNFVCYWEGKEWQGTTVLPNTKGLRRLPAKRKRPMTRWEILAWANSEASWGWVVQWNEYNWDIPQRFSYDNDNSQYQRARLLPDLSGVDESTIQGLEVEE